MILSILTGGIDLPKLNTRVLNLDTQHATTMSLLSNTVAAIYGARGIVGKEDRQFGDPYETRYESLSDRLDAIENLIASRALAEDVETLRLKLNRLDGEIGNCTFGDMPMREDGFTPFGLSGFVSGLAAEVAQLKASNAVLHVSVDALSAKVEALTAAKLSEVKARKAPKKSG
jgi:hypothetical protein